MTVSDALRHGFLDRGRKHFCNAYTGDICSLDEALKNGWIILKSNYDKSKTQAGFSFRGGCWQTIFCLLSRRGCYSHATMFYSSGQTSRKLPANVGPSGFQSFTILSVLDAKTGEDLSVAEAVRRGILDHTKRNYRDNLTGEMMVLDTAVKRSELNCLPYRSLYYPPFFQPAAVL